MILCNEAPSGQKYPDCGIRELHVHVGCNRAIICKSDSLIVVWRYICTTTTKVHRK